jgi:hypothetical protein
MSDQNEKAAFEATSPQGWRAEAAMWLREKAAAQDAICDASPAGDKAYPTWRMFARKFRMLAAELEELAAKPRTAEAGGAQFSKATGFCVNQHEDAITVFFGKVLTETEIESFKAKMLYATPQPAAKPSDKAELKRLVSLVFGDEFQIVREPAAKPAQAEPGKWAITLEDLYKLSDIARVNGTTEAFFQVVLQWAEKANAEIARLRAAQAEPDAVPKGVLLAITNAGLTLVKTQYGYQLLNIGKAVAQ